MRIWAWVEQVATITGSCGNDTITGTTAADTIYGGARDEALLGGQGHDQLYGSAGIDVMRGADCPDLDLRDLFVVAKNGPINRMTAAGAEYPDG